MTKWLLRGAVSGLLGFASAHAQLPPVQLQAELLSGWLVTVEGEARTRTLRIKGMEQKDAETFLLDADYGWSDGKQSPVRAELRQSAQERVLLITTQPGSKLVATQKKDGIFEGTFTPVSGQVKGLKIERLSDADLVMTKSKVSKSSGPEIAPPGPDVPTECAAWSGAWSGQWQAHGYQSRSQLWVRSVDKDCNASIASSGTMEWKIHNVKGGRISNVFCNRQTGGVCRFVISSDLSTLTANYENAQGGRNWGEFTKVLPK